MATPERGELEEIIDSSSSIFNLMDDPGSLASGGENYSFRSSLDWNSWNPLIGLLGVVIFNEMLMPPEVMKRPEERDSLSSYVESNDVQSSIPADNYNWIGDPSYSASGGEDLETSLLSVMKRPEERDSLSSYVESNDVQSSIPADNYNWIGDPSYSASGGEDLETSLLSKSKNICKIKISDGTLQPIVCQETDNDGIICIHDPRTVITESLERDYNIALERHIHRMSGQTELTSQSQITFTYLEVDSFGHNIQTSSMIVPSTAYYSSNHFNPIFFPTSHNPNPVLEIVHAGSNQYFNTNSAYSFSKITESVSQSDEAHSDEEMQ